MSINVFQSGLRSDDSGEIAEVCTYDIFLIVVTRQRVISLPDSLLQGEGMVNYISDQRFLLGVPATASVTSELSGLARENGLFSRQESTVIPGEYVITFEPEDMLSPQKQENELNAVLSQMREWNPGSMKLYVLNLDGTRKIHAFLNGYLGRQFGGGVDLVICDITGRVITGIAENFTGLDPTFSIYSAGQKCFKPDANPVEEILLREQGKQGAHIYSAKLPCSISEDTFTAPEYKYLLVEPQYASHMSSKKIEEAIGEIEKIFSI